MAKDAEHLSAEKDLRKKHMSAAIKLINPPLDQVIQEESVEKHQGNVFSIELAPEQGLKHALDYISQLHTEIKDLRGKLLLAERALARKDQLLRNNLVREQALRASLVEKVF